MQLIQALRYNKKATMAFVGAGGKTTALFTSARELMNKESAAQGKRVIVTTTTHLGRWQTGMADQVVRINSLTDLLKFENTIPDGLTLLVGEEKGDRLTGIGMKLLERIHGICTNLQIPLLIEADGARSLPLKAPSSNEPVIPDFSEIVVVVAGLAGLGKPLSGDWVHRPELYSELSGIKIGEQVSPQAIINVLANERGGLKNIPGTAIRKILLNQADTKKLQSDGAYIGKQLISVYHSAIVATLSNLSNEKDYVVEIYDKNQGEIHFVVEQIAGIVLAAGDSTRFGKEKQLLPWKDQPFIRHVVMAALKAGLSPVIVVVGSSGEPVASAISDMPVRIVTNSEWLSGVSSSIRVGVGELPGHVGGAVFLQADQPQISPLLIQALIQAHQGSLNPIITPWFNGQRGNPVLFDREIFSDLTSLKGDIGGRVLFTDFPIERVEWHDPNQFLDIDTPEDYKNFLITFPNGIEQT